jgi:NitT/TauT family transport system permease protein
LKKETVARTLFLLALLALVEILCRIGLIPSTVMAAPSIMAVQTIRVLIDGKFNRDLATSGLEILTAAILAVAAGFIAGVALHALPRLRSSIEPLLSTYYAVPTFIFYPVFIVLLGVGPLPIIAIAVLLAMVTMMTATLDGLDRIPTSLRKTAQVMRLSPMARAIHIYLPATMPYLFTGIKLSVAYAFIGVIASEFILSGSGVGYAIGYAYNNFQNNDMYALMLLVLLTITAINAALNHVDRRLQSRRRR